MTSREPNKDGEVKDELPNVQYVEMNEGTTKLPDDKPAEDGGELMAKEPKEFELESMFPADVLRDTEENVFVEWLCIVAKM